jgi:hypothetical protein
MSLVALVGVLLGGAPAAAVAGQPTPTPNPSAVAAPPAVKGTAVCQVTDKNALEISGIAISNNVLYALNDSTNADARRKVFKINPSTCAVIGSPIAYPARPRDPEDLAVDVDGAIWIADIGDNAADRTNVALWKLANDKITGPFRLSYPDGKKYDAEAMVIGSDGLPIIITKLESLVFTPTGPLQANSTNGVPMKQVGKVTLPKTTTESPLGGALSGYTTGAAVSADRKKVVLRTYADAFEWDVPDGDIVKAITSAKPRITPLPMEPWGEAITYSPDGKFWTISDVETYESTTKIKPELLSYQPNNEDPNPPSPAAKAQPPQAQSKAWWSELISSTDRLYLLIGAVGILGLLLVLAGILGIRRSRKRRREQDEDDERLRGRGRRDDGLDDGYYDQRAFGYQGAAYGYQDQGGGNAFGPPQGGGNAFGPPQGGGNVYGSAQPQYGYEDPYYGPPPTQPPPPQQQQYGPPPQQYGQQQYGQPQYGQQQPGYGYPDYPDQSYGQNYR